MLGSRGVPSLQSFSNAKRAFVNDTRVIKIYVMVEWPRMFCNVWSISTFFDIPDMFFLETPCMIDTMTVKFDIISLSDEQKLLFSQILDHNTIDVVVRTHLIRPEGFKMICPNPSPNHSRIRERSSSLHQSSTLEFNTTWQYPRDQIIRSKSLNHMYLRVHSFGMIQIGISDPRSLGSWCTKTTNKSLRRVDSLASLKQHDLSDQWSWFWFWSCQRNACTQWLNPSWL